MARKTIISLQNEISTLKTERDNFSAKIIELEKSNEIEKENLKKDKEQLISEKDQLLVQKEEAFKQERATLKEEIEKLKSEVKEKQGKIDIRELKKFAEAFGEQEENFKGDADKWFGYVLGAFVLIILATWLIIEHTQSVTLFNKIGYYFMDIILITFLIFSLKQYSYYVKLSTDYGNRKTLAQSYHNIVNSTDDSVIKNKFLDKASDILASKVEVENESYTIPEKILENVTEIAKSLSKK